MQARRPSWKRLPAVCEKAKTREMRPVPVLLAALLATLAATVIACGPPKMPTGPAPEYEDPPAPSWLKGDGGAPASIPAPAVAPAGDGAGS